MPTLWAYHSRKHETMGTYINKGNSNFRDIVLVGINYDKETKQHTCRIERVEKQS